MFSSSSPLAEKTEHLPEYEPVHSPGLDGLIEPKPQDIVLDPFCGSGATTLAARQAGRRFIGIEKDRYYHQIAEKRLNMC